MARQLCASLPRAAQCHCGHRDWSPQLQTTSAPAGPWVALCQGAARCLRVSWGRCRLHPHMMGLLSCSWTGPSPAPGPVLPQVRVQSPQVQGHCGAQETQPWGKVAGTSLQPPHWPWLARGRHLGTREAPCVLAGPGPSRPLTPLHSTHGALEGRSVLMAPSTAAAPGWGQPEPGCSDQARPCRCSTSTLGVQQTAPP